MSKTGSTAALPGIPSSLVRSEHIDLQLKARTLESAIKELGALVKSHPAVRDSSALEHAILERERLSSTAVVPGIALPHARTSAARDFLLAIGRSAEGIPLPGVTEPIRLVFMLAAPMGKVGSHLAIVARLTRALAREPIRTSLLTEGNAEEFARILTAAL